MFFAKMNVIGRTVGVDLLPLAGRQPGLARMVREAGDCTTFGGSRVEATWSLCSGFSHGRSWSAASTLQRRDLPEIAPGVWDVEMRAPVGAVADTSQTTQGAGRRPAATRPAPELLRGARPHGLGALPHSGVGPPTARPRPVLRSRCQMAGGAIVDRGHLPGPRRR